MNLQEQSALVSRLLLQGVSTNLAYRLVESHGSFVTIADVAGAGWWTGSEIIPVRGAGAGSTHQLVLLQLAANHDPRVLQMGVKPDDSNLGAEAKALAAGWIRYQFPNDSRWGVRGGNGGARPYAMQSRSLPVAKDFVEILLLNDTVKMGSEVIVADESGNRALFRGTVEDLLN